jgi:hypothetical protein
MYKTISKEIIKRFDPNSELINIITDENEELPVKEWVEKYRNKTRIVYIIWLLLRKEFMSDKDLKLYKSWSAQEALNLLKNKDKENGETYTIYERYYNGQATKEELIDAASNAAASTKSRKAQLDKLLTYF